MDPTTTHRQQADFGALRETSLAGVSAALIRAKYQFESSGFAVVEDHQLGLSHEFTLAVTEALALENQGTYLASINHSELVFVEDGKSRIDSGQKIHALANTAEMRAIAAMFGGVPQTLWHVTMNIAKKGEHHPTHRDWRATNPIWLSLIRQSHYDGPPVLQVRDKTSGEWTAVDASGDKWVVLDAFTDHRVTTLPAARRSFVISYAPEQESLRDIRSQDFRWREDLVPPLEDLRE